MHSVGFNKYIYHIARTYNETSYLMSSHQGQSIIFVLWGATTLREEHWLRVSENSVVRKIFAPKRDEVTGEWRRLHNEELYDVYSSPNTMALGPTQPLTEMSTRSISWG